MRHPAPPALPHGRGDRPAEPQGTLGVHTSGYARLAGPLGLDPHVAQLTEELTITAGARFSDRLQAPPALPSASGIERLLHPAVGELRLAYETLELPDADDQRLVVYLPADHATTAALDQLTDANPAPCARSSADDGTRRSGMSVFTPVAIEYLRSQVLAAWPLSAMTASPMWSP